MTTILKITIFFKFHPHFCHPLLIAARGGPPLPPLPRYATVCKTSCVIADACYCREILTEKEFLDLTTSEERCVVHFYHTDFRRCAIMHTHLEVSVEVCHIKINSFILIGFLLYVLHYDSEKIAAGVTEFGTQ